MKTKMQNVIRKESLSQFGFGLDAMKKFSVCPNCHSLENSKNTLCSICKTKINKYTLYDIYRSKHKTCPECKTVVANGMQFCPHCGQLLNTEAVAVSI